MYESTICRVVHIEIGLIGNELSDNCITTSTHLRSRTMATQTFVPSSASGCLPSSIKRMFSSVTVGRTRLCSIDAIAKPIKLTKNGDQNNAFEAGVRHQPIDFCNDFSNPTQRFS